MPLPSALAHARLLVTERPDLYPLLRRVQAWANLIHRQAFCTQATDLCLEGYPACANSFLFFVFQESAPDGPLAIGHHTHSVANVKRALRYGVPTVVTFRDPADAIPSYLARFEHDLHEATLRYLRFYRYVLRVAPRLTLAAFEDVVAQPATVVARAADDAGLTLDPGDPQTLTARVEARMQAQWSREAGDLFSRRRLPLPNDERAQAKARVRERLARLPLFDEAAATYHALRDRATALAL
jgi:hypothetical protein